MSKVIVRIKGGFGNQLFCYAAARRLGLVNNSELVIDEVTGFVRDHQYRRQYVLDRFHISARKATAIERMEPFERYRRGLAKFVSRRKPFLKRRYVEQEGREFDARLLDIKVEKTIYLDGLWQSENYFRDVSQTIRRDLRTIPPKDTINQNMAGKIRKCTSIAVHVRWFDKSDNGSVGYNLKCSYYARATKEIMGRVTMPHFFIFSNNPEATRQMLDLPEDIVTYVDHNRGDDNAYADFWLMTQCKHFIIANSTFSWWGGWLAESKSKIIIAPSLKLIGVNSWGFDGLIPDGWMLL